MRAVGVTNRSRSHVSLLRKRNLTQLYHSKGGYFLRSGTAAPASARPRRASIWEGERRDHDSRRSGVAVRVGVAVIGVHGVFVGVAVAHPAGVFVGVGVAAIPPHSPVWHSNAPISQAEPCGRAMPRWSVAGGGQPLAAFNAGAARGERVGLRRAAVAGERLQERIAYRNGLPRSCFRELEVGAAVGDNRAAAVQSRDRVGDDRVLEGERGSVPRMFAPEEVAEFMAMVLLMIVTVASLRMNMPPPTLPAPVAVLPLMVLLVIVNRAGLLTFVEPFRKCRPRLRGAIPGNRRVRDRRRAVDQGRARPLVAGALVPADRAVGHRHAAREKMPPP